MGEMPRTYENNKIYIIVQSSKGRIKSVRVFRNSSYKLAEALFIETKDRLRGRMDDVAFFCGQLDRDIIQSAERMI